MHRHKTAIFAFIALLTLAGGCASLTTTNRAASPGALPDEITAQNIGQYYVKREFRIPMRDGVRLHTKVLIPKDRSKEHPILLRRTPYSCSPYGPGEFSRSIGRYDRYLRDGYILAFQDVRGTYMSEGEFINMRPHNPGKQSASDVDESTDAYDTIEWLINNVPNNNGNVGMWGISYPGFYAAASMIDAHPALKASSPQAPIADWWFDDFHHHGAFFLPHCFRFISSFGLPRPEPTTERRRREFEIWSPDGYAFYLDMGPLSNANERYLKGNVEFWNKTVEHPNYDEFWQSRNILPHLNNVAPAVMTVGGWFDAEDLYGPLQIYRSVEQKNPDVFNVLVMGPWAHGGWSRGDGDRLGNAYFGGPTSPWYQEQVEKKFFDHYLRDGKTSPVDLPEATVFETGANEWREFDVWPPAEMTDARMYLHGDGSMNFNRPASSGESYREYISDPDKPVPFTEEIAQGMTREYMTDDQRFAGRRPDVLVYQTDVLEEDLTIAGPIIANLMVSTSGTDSDWIVKVIDVHPHDMEDFPGIREGTRTAGYQMMVRSEVMRGRFRNSYEFPEGFVPNEPTLVRLPLQDVLHTFKKGHRMMVQIQSTWFPLIDRNPQQFVPNIFLADEDDFITATQRVYSSPEHATWLEIGVLGDFTPDISDAVEVNNNLRPIRVSRNRLPVGIEHNEGYVTIGEGTFDGAYTGMIRAPTQMLGFWQPDGKRMVKVRVDEESRAAVFSVHEGHAGSSEVYLMDDHEGQHRPVGYMYQRHDRQVEVKLRHKPPLAHLQEFPIPNAVAGEKLVLLFYVDEGRRVRELVVGDAIVGTCDIAVEQAAGAE